MTYEETFLSPDEIRMEVPCEPPVRKTRTKPHIMIRVPLQILSFVLSSAMFVTALAGALVLDVQRLTSSGGIEGLINAAMGLLTGDAANITHEPSRIAPLSARYDEEETGVTEYFSYVIDENGNVVIIDENGNVVGDEDGKGYYVDENGNMIIYDGDLSDYIDENGYIIMDDFEDLFAGENEVTDVGGLVDWFYEEISDGGELPITKEQLQAFVADSSFSNYLSEKLAGFADDYINGTSNTTISAEEIMDLLEDNADKMQEHLGIELSPETKQELSDSLHNMIQESGINETIREEVFGAVDEMLNEVTASVGVSMDQVHEALQFLSSDTMRNLVFIVNGALLLLLCLLNFYNVPAGLTWAASPCIWAGVILSAPLFLMDSMAVSGEGAQVMSLVTSFAGVLKPIHFGLLAIGIGLLVISIAWRVIRANRSAN